MPLHNRWSNVECLLAEGKAEQQEKLCHAWMEGFSVIIRIPQRGSVCIFIYIYFLYVWHRSRQEHFASYLYRLCPYSILLVMIDLVTCFRGSVWLELGILIHQHVSGLALTNNTDRWHVQGILKLEHVQLEHNQRKSCVTASDDPKVSLLRPKVTVLRCLQ